MNLSQFYHIWKVKFTMSFSLFLRYIVIMFVVNMLKCLIIICDNLCYICSLYPNYKETIQYVIYCCCHSNEVHEYHSNETCHQRRHKVKLYCHPYCQCNCRKAVLWRIVVHGLRWFILVAALQELLWIVCFRFKSAMFIFIFVNINFVSFLFNRWRNWHLNF